MTGPGGSPFFRPRASLVEILKLITRRFGGPGLMEHFKHFNTAGFSKAVISSKKLKNQSQ